ncbi:hypothetical protein ONJ16_26200, partial [Salmonella enterica subsp. enterica serovar Montevideo]|nr:hypothetical protein [Salmonella enterica subsp. enterica serovar Montevideo]
AVRHALALSINNQRLMQSIYYGTAETAASILPRASWAYDNDADAKNVPDNKLMWYVIIHLTFVLSAFVMGYLDRLTRHNH